MRVIVSGGGTGGHIYPAITLINTIKELAPDTEFLYVGTAKGLEADIIPREQIPFTTLEISGFKRQLSLDNLFIAGRALTAMIKARQIIKRFKPDVAIGTGGYVCGPILLAAAMMGIPTLIQEQNAIPGVTNKILAKVVKRIAVGYEGAKAHFPAGKTVFTGNPIRSDILSSTHDEGFKEFGLDPSRITILVSGGSRGAHTINEAMLAVQQHFQDNERVQLIHVTGKNDYEFVRQGMAARSIRESANIKVYPYLYDMPKAMAVADLAISRAGATSLAELTVRGVPMILVPYPYAAANHQLYNARELEQAGAAKVILNRDLTGDKLIETIHSVLSEPNILPGMAAASRKLGQPQAAETIAKMVINLANSD